MLLTRDEQLKRTKIKATIIADSTNWTSSRLTSFVLEYPRYIHSELLTHRVFSKNSASSRAIPVSKFIQSVMDSPAVPTWTHNRPGMQGEIMDDEETVARLDGHWVDALKFAALSAEHWSVSLGAHKQNANRILEPWMVMKVILTGTEFTNFFELRDHKDAMPEIQLLAFCMKEAMSKSRPQFLQIGMWHMPFWNQGDDDALFNFEGIPDAPSMSNETRAKVATARCARVSYGNVDGSSSSLLKDLDLYDKLVGSSPKHLSPTEHIAKVPRVEDYREGHMGVRWDEKIRSQEVGKYFSNLRGWIQYRKLVEYQ